jgi:hypothetical protein
VLKSATILILDRYPQAEETDKRQNKT